MGTGRALSITTTGRRTSASGFRCSSGSENSAPLRERCSAFDHHRDAADPGLPFARPGLVHRLAGRVHRHGHRHVLHGELRTEEHTSELQSLMRTSYAVLRLKKKNYT